jgi:hypothetical protein
MKNRKDPCGSKSMFGWRSRCSAISAMIYWESQSNEMKVACSACGSMDTRVSFEFLCYTRHTCRTCSMTFTDSSGRLPGRGCDHDAPANNGGSDRDASPSALKNPAVAVSAETALALAVFGEPLSAVNREVSAR